MCNSSEEPGGSGTIASTPWAPKAHIVLVAHLKRRRLNRNRGSGTAVTATSKRKRLLLRVLQYAGITIGTLVVVDLLTILLGVFPPTHDYGDPDVGWVPFNPTGRMHTDRCTEYSTGAVFEFARNEDGIRTQVGVEQLLTDSPRFKLAVTGDSQTELCAPNAETHAGVLESELNSAGTRAVVLPYGTGRYSPLQAYLLFKKALVRYAPHAFVLNFYTGNDFFDLLRVDDRPHLVSTDGGYVIAPPVWYLLDDPQVTRRSRVLFAARSLAEAFGIRNLFLRVRFLRRIAAEQGRGLGAVLGYMKDVRDTFESSVGYSGAFAAQMLNQQLFFHWFPGSRDESIRRAGALMQLIRAENPNTLLIMSPLPSYELARQRPVDSALTRVLERLPISHESGVREEHQLYETLRVLADEHGWLFVDNLASLWGYDGADRLYNDFDYHLLPVASAIIGKNQARAILDHLRSGSQ